MKKAVFLLVAAFAAGVSAHAATDPGADINNYCVNVYRNASQNMLEDLGNFRDSKISIQQLGFLAAQTSVAADTEAVVCSVVEGPEIKSCIDSYSDIYQGLRSRVKALSAVLGTQQKVDDSVLALGVVHAHILLVDVRCAPTTTPKPKE